MYILVLTSERSSEIHSAMWSCISSQHWIHFEVSQGPGLAFKLTSLILECISEFKKINFQNPQRFLHKSLQPLDYLMTLKAYDWGFFELLKCNCKYSYFWFLSALGSTPFNMFQKAHFPLIFDILWGNGI